MDIANEAQDILSTLKEICFPVIAAAFLLTMFAVAFRRSSYTWRENLRVSAGILAGAAMLFGLMFMNVEGGKIVDVMKAYPLWGVYVILLVILGAGVVVTTFYGMRLKNQEVIGLTTTTDAASPSARRDLRLSVLGGAWVVGVIMAVVWLVGIARPK